MAEMLGPWDAAEGHFELPKWAVENRCPLCISDSTMTTQQSRSSKQLIWFAIVSAIRNQCDCGCCGERRYRDVEVVESERWC